MSNAMVVAVQPWAARSSSVSGRVTKMLDKTGISRPRNGPASPSGV